VRQPPLESMIGKMDSKYTLIVVAAKRARAIVEGEKSLLDELKGEMKPVSVAFDEIDRGILSYQRAKDSIK